MTTEEIKAIIAEKIAGQGNQVDIGGALAEILNAFAENLAELDEREIPTVAVVEISGNFEAYETSTTFNNIEAFIDELGITREQLRSLLFSDMAVLGDANYQLTRTYCGRRTEDLGGFEMQFGGTSEDAGMIVYLVGNYNSFLIHTMVV